jgi:hypothetical protein
MDNIQKIEERIAGFLFQNDIIIVSSEQTENWEALSLMKYDSEGKKGKFATIIYHVNGGLSTTYNNVREEIQNVQLFREEIIEPFRKLLLQEKGAFYHSDAFEVIHKACDLVNEKYSKD